MARRRAPGRSGGNNQALMAMYNDITSREAAAEQAQVQARLNQELARLQSQLRQSDASFGEGINTDQQILGRVLSNPRDAARLIGDRPTLAGISTKSLLPTPQTLLDPVNDQTRQAKNRFEVPGEEDIFSALGQTREEVADPVIGQMIENIDQPRVDPRTPMLSAASSALGARESRLNDMGTAEGMDILTKGLGAQETALGTARGQEAGEAESFGANLGRALTQQNTLGAAKNAQELAQFQAMTPLEVARTRAMEQAKTEVEQSAADTAGLIAVASSAPLAQSIIEAIVGPQGNDPTSGQPYAQDPRALARLDPNTGIRGSEAFKNTYGGGKGWFQGYLDPNVQSRINQLTSQLTTQALTDLRKQVSTGASPMGQASDRDVNIIMQGVTRLGTYRIDSADAEGELKRIYDASLRLQQRAEAAKAKLSGAGRLPSALGVQPQMQTPQVPTQPTGQTLRAPSGRVYTRKQ